MWLRTRRLKHADGENFRRRRNVEYARDQRDAVSDQQLSREDSKRPQTQRDVIAGLASTPLIWKPGLLMPQDYAWTHTLCGSFSLSPHERYIVLLPEQAWTGDAICWWSWEKRTGLFPVMKASRLFQADFKKERKKKSSNHERNAREDECDADCWHRKWHYALRRETQPLVQNYDDARYYAIDGCSGPKTK